MSARRETFRSRFNRVLSIVIWVVCAGVAGLVLLTPGSPLTLVDVVPVAGVAAAVWVLLWRPHVEVDDEAVLIANATHEVRVPWEAVIHVDTKYALTVHAPGRRITATGAPAPGRMTTIVARRGDVSGDGSEAARPGDLVSTDSGRAAQLVRERWAALRDAGRIEAGVADEAAVRTRVDAVAVATLAVALVGSIAALAFGG